MTAQHPALFGNVAEVVDVAYSRLPSALVLSSPDEQTKDTRARWLEAESRNEQMCAALDGSTITAQSPRDPITGRIRVQKLRMGDGRLLRVEGRPTSPERVPVPARTGLYIGACRCAYLVGYDSNGQQFSTNPVTCRNNLCSWCAGRKASEKVRQWLPLFMALYEDGHQLVHLTLTQPTMEGDPDAEPVHLTDFEQRHMSYAGVVAAPDEEAVSTPGEVIGSGIDRLLHSFKRLRRGTRGMARAWERSIAGGLYSVEATGMTMRDDAAVLRWHVHIHAVLVLPHGTATRFAEDDGRAVVSRDDPWFSDLIQRWCSITGAAPGGQHCELVSAGARVRGALTEVLKYPTKTATLTDAQKHDWLVSTKGRRMHAQPFGSLIGSSRAHTLVRWFAAVDEEGAHSGSPDSRARELLLCPYEAPADVQRAYRRLVSSHDGGAEMLRVLVSHAKHLAAPEPEEGTTALKRVYVPTGLHHPAAKLVPGLGPAVLLTRRMVCESLLSGVPIDMAVQGDEDGEWVVMDADPSELLQQLVASSIAAVVRGQQPLTHGNKVDAFSQEPSSPTSAEPENRITEASCFQVTGPLSRAGPLAQRQPIET